MSRSIEAIVETGDETNRRASELKVFKYLPDNQKYAVLDLLYQLIRFERINQDPEFQSESVSCLLASITSIQRALEIGVPREVLLAVLDKDISKPKPVEGHVNAG